MNILKKNHYFLAIETSCDDTSLCLINNDNIFLKTVSSIKQQNEFGGIVPEIAARSHEENINNCFKQLLNEAKINITNIQAIAYTLEPGLKTCLNVGKIFADSLSLLLNIKAYPINHITAHMFSYAIDNKHIEYPFLAMVVSGGTTAVFKVNSLIDIEILNQTSDDAVGEVFDKVARKLNLGYPGGPKIDMLYDCSRTTITFQKKRSENNSLSFSGLKSAVLNYINNSKHEIDNSKRIEIASSFQKTIIDETLSKLHYYAKLHKVKYITIGGGVAANDYLRSEISKMAIKTYLPLKKYCGDNAAMIGVMCLINLGLW